MISCLIVFSIMSFKVLILDDKPNSNEPDDVKTEEENTEKGDKGDGKKDDNNVNSSTPAEINPADAPFTTADATYLEDALFIGDSRTMGLWEYGQVKGADFFANTGMSVYNVREKVVNVNSTGSVNLDQLLSKKSYGKIYLMLGINELGYDQDQTVAKYKELVDYIRAKAPNSKLFIGANLHVSAARSDSDKIFNNTNINNFNSRISKFIDNKNIYYIDINEHFDDEKGNLAAEYTSDNTHVLGKYYVDWINWILTKAIV